MAGEHGLASLEVPADVNRIGLKCWKGGGCYVNLLVTADLVLLMLYKLKGFGIMAFECICAASCASVLPFTK